VILNIGHVTIHIGHVILHIAICLNIYRSEFLTNNYICHIFKYYIILNDFPGIQMPPSIFFSFFNIYKT